MQEQEQLPAPFIDLPGIDAALGLMTWGDEEVYKRSLVGFGQQHAHDGAAIRAALDQGDIQKVKSISHTLKGVAGNLSATDLAHAAADLDRALSMRGGEQITLVELNAILRQRNIELGDLVQSVDQALNMVVASCQRLAPQTQDKATPTTFVSNTLEDTHIEWLRQLAQSLERGNAEQAETIFAELQACAVIEPESMEKIASQMDDFELDEARKTLANIAQSLEINLESS